MYLPCELPKLVVEQLAVVCCTIRLAPLGQWYCDNAEAGICEYACELCLHHYLVGVTPSAAKLTVCMTLLCVLLSFVTACCMIQLVADRTPFLHHAAPPDCVVEISMLSCLTHCLKCGLVSEQSLRFTSHCRKSTVVLACTIRRNMRSDAICAGSIRRVDCAIVRCAADSVCRRPREFFNSDRLKFGLQLACCANVQLEQRASPGRTLYHR